MKIYPAILHDSISTVQSQIDVVQVDCSTLHIDIIDGEFVNNLTIDVQDLKELRFYDCSFDLHLIMNEPSDYIEELDPSLPIRRIYAQIERMHHPDWFIRETKERSWEPGYALDLYTEPHELSEMINAHPVSHVLLMNVPAGQQAQEFSKLGIDKVDVVNSLDSVQSIILDGGVGSKQELQEIMTKNTNLTSSKMDGVVIGSWIWTADSPSTHFKQLQAQVQ